MTLIFMTREPNRGFQLHGYAEIISTRRSTTHGISYLAPLISCMSNLSSLFRVGEVFDLQWVKLAETIIAESSRALFDALRDLKPFNTSDEHKPQELDIHLARKLIGAIDYAHEQQRNK